jgi:hypothetical protein
MCPGRQSFWTPLEDKSEAPPIRTNPSVIFSKDYGKTRMALKTAFLMTEFRTQGLQKAKQEYQKLNPEFACCLINTLPDILDLSTAQYRKRSPLQLL